MCEQIYEIWESFRDQIIMFLNEKLAVNAFVGISKTGIYIVVPSMNYRYEYGFDEFYEDIYKCTLSAKMIYERFEKGFKKFVISRALKSIFKEESL